MRQRSRVTALRRQVVASAILLAACASESLTEVVVIVERDSDVDAEGLSITVTDPNDSSAAPFTISSAPWNDDGNYTLGISPSRSGTSGRYRVDVKALKDGQPGATARLISGYVVGQTRYVRLLLDASCGMTCDLQSTCWAAQCVSAEVPENTFASSSELASATPWQSNECAISNVCTTADYPCQLTAPSGYTCRGQLADWHMPDFQPGAKYSPSYDWVSTPGVVLDRVTGLRWQRDVPLTYPACTGKAGLKSAGEFGPPGSACTRAEASRYCDRLTTGGWSDWRLPSKIELESIVDDTKGFPGPTIEPLAFPNTPGRTYWTGSPVAGQSGHAWVVDFFGGGSHYTVTIKETARVRCVR